MERFVHVIFRNHSVSWVHLPYVLVRNTQFGVYPFRVRFMCMYTLRIYWHSGVDSKDKLLTFCTLCLHVMFAFHIYPNTTSYQVAAGQIICNRKGHHLFFQLMTLLFVNFTFFTSFLRIENLWRRRKASGKQIICTVNDLLSTCSSTAIILPSFLDAVQKDFLLDVMLFLPTVTTVKPRWHEHRWLIALGWFELVFESLRSSSESTRKQLFRKIFLPYH